MGSSRHFIQTTIGYKNVYVRQILNYIEKGSIESDLARLSALEPTVTDSVIVTRYPHLTAAIFMQLVIRTAGDVKEVSRICGGMLSGMLRALPFVQSVTLVNNVIRTESSPRVVVALKQLDKLLKHVEEKHVKDNTKEIILGLLKVNKLNKPSRTCKHNISFSRKQ